MSKARRKGFTDGTSSYMDEEDYQEEAYMNLSEKYNVNKDDVERIVKEVFEKEEPQQRFFIYWTREHAEMFDKAMKEYIKNKSNGS